MKDVVPEQDGSNRILALQNGQLTPLIPATPVGRPSPSKSLLLEKYELEQPARQTHQLTSHVVTLFLTSSTVRHARENRPEAELPLEAGQAVLCIRGDAETLAWQQPMSFLCARIEDSVLREASHSLTGRDPVGLEPKYRIEDPRLTNLLYALEAERAQDYSSGKLFLDSLESALAVLLVTSHSVTRCPAPANNGGLTPQRLRRVLDFMHANLRQPLGLEDLASHAQLSPSHFAHQFRITTGISPYKHLLAMRIDRAKRLLKNRALSILDVGLEVGFENQQHFSTVFRRVAGATPSAYRRGL